MASRWVAILKASVHAIDDDNCLGLAAQLAFYFLLALFPALLFLVALVGCLPIQNAMAELLSVLGTVAPREVVDLLRAQLGDIARGGRVDVLTLGVAGAVWSSSAAMVAIIDALNRAYRVAEWRPWWKRQLVAVALTLAFTVFTAISLSLILIGPSVAARVATWFGVGPMVAWAWYVLRWPTMIFLVVFGMDLVYHFAPNRKERWTWFTLGSLVATLLWIVSSFVFKWYITNFGTYNATYGAIGGVIVVLLWLYVSGLAILIGAELNGVIARTSRQAADGAWSGPPFGDG